MHHTLSMALLLHRCEAGRATYLARGADTDAGAGSDSDPDEPVVLDANRPRPNPGDVLCLLDARPGATALATVLTVTTGRDGRLRAWVRPWPERLEYAEVTRACSAAGIRLDGTEAVGPRAAAELYRLLRIGRR